MRSDEACEEIEARAEAAARETGGEPPVAYIPACGTLCDAFWWARKSPPAKVSD